MFAAEFETAVTSNRRRSPRAPVSLDAKIGRGGLDRALCRVVDISMEGARLSTYSALSKGTVIWLTLPIAGPVAATVMWGDDFSAGCLFQSPLSEADFEALVKLGERRG